MIKDLILKSHFNRFLESWNINNAQNVHEETREFERFVNYTILSMDDPSAFIGKPELLDCCCVGGADDAKLDGIGVKVNGQIVSSEEEILQIVGLSKKIEVEFVIIQSKEQTNFDNAEFNTFGIGVQNFFSEPSLPENDAVGRLRQLKDFIYSDKNVIRKLDANPSLSVYYVFAGTTPDEEHLAGLKMIMKDNLAGCRDCLGAISIDVIDGKHLVQVCKELENDFCVELNTRDIIPLTVNENCKIKKAYAFTCEALELLKLLGKEDGTIRRSLFNDNVRDYLGNRGGVNSEIEQTIIGEPEMFLMCNNGITIVCSDFIQIRDKLVSINNPQVVNGCQTCNSIFRFKDNITLSKVQVLIKLICTEDISITNKIVRGTNKQNQVLEEAFETTKPFHQDLEDFFLAKQTDFTLYYERRSKQYSALPTINKNQIVNLRVITQVFVATFLTSPHEAHRHEAKLLELYAGDDNDKRKIYNKKHAKSPYFLCAMIWYKFEEWFKNGLIERQLKTYKAHLYLLFLYSLGKFPVTDCSNARVMNAYCSEIENLLLSKDVTGVIDRVVEVFQKSMDLWVSHGKSQYAVKDRKEFTSMMLELARKYLIGQETLEKPKATPQLDYMEGRILVANFHKEQWFCFIKTSRFPENIYFDSRNYNGEIRKLLPNTKVKFVVKSRNKNGEKLFYADNVVVIKEGDT